jgi:hypothetical protein
VWGFSLPLHVHAANYIRIKDWFEAVVKTISKDKDDTSTDYASTSCGICGKKGIDGFSKMIAPHLCRLWYVQKGTLINDNVLYKASFGGFRLVFCFFEGWLSQELMVVL